MRPDAFASSPVLRFAPSPNGALHLGHAYSALCNERLAAELGGRLLLSIEDLDRTRCKSQYEAAILHDLAWLGLCFEAEPRRQSEHGDVYAEALARLEAHGLVYPCFCSRGEVARASAAHDPDGGPLCPGTCRALSRGERAGRLGRGDKAALRLDMRRAIESAPAGIVWPEFGEGSSPIDRPAEPALWGDLVLAGRGLAASYHLAVTVDDALQGVTDVVRGRDLLPEPNCRRAASRRRSSHCARRARPRRKSAPRSGGGDRGGLSVALS